MQFGLVGARIAVFFLALLLVACGGGSGGGTPPPVGPPGPQVGSLSVDLASGTVTVTTQPSHLTLSGAAVYDAGTMTVAIDLDVLNSAFGRLIFNLKAQVTGTNEGSVTGDGTFGGDPYVYYGPNALAPGAMETRTITVNNVTGAVDPITVDLALPNHPMIFVPQGSGPSGMQAVDSSGSGQSFAIDNDALIWDSVANNGNNWTSDGVVSPDGRFLYTGFRCQPTVVVIDTTTMTPVLTADLSGAGNLQTDGSGTIGTVDKVRMSPDTRFLYAPLTLNRHTYDDTLQGAMGSNPDCYLVKIDRATMTEVGRVTLILGSTNDARAKAFSCNAAGTWGVTSLNQEGQVFLIDLVTMTIIDTDAGVPGVQPYDVSAMGMAPRDAAMSPDGSRIYVGFTGDDGSDGTLGVIDTATGMMTPLPLPSTYVRNYIGNLVFGPDGKLYFAHGYTTIVGEPGLSIYDPATMLWTEFYDPSDALVSLFFSHDGTRYYTLLYNLSPNEIRAYQIGTDTVIPNEADGGPGIVLPQSGNWGHLGVITPF
ncbi:MAG: hypothetical protein ACYTG6_06405 [Planctomycetota bacterium]|jgi:hypothetical protein